MKATFAAALSLFVVALLSAWGPPPSSQVDEKFTYQGRLTNPDGTPVLDDLYDFTFTVLDADTNEPKGPSIKQQIMVENGLFSTDLHFVGLFDGDKVKLGYEVNGENLGATELTAVPFATTALKLKLPFVATVESNDQLLQLTNSSGGSIFYGSGGTFGATPLFHLNNSESGPVFIARGVVPAGSSPNAVLELWNDEDGRALRIIARATSPQSAIVVNNTGTGAAMSLTNSGTGSILHGTGSTPEALFHLNNGNGPVLLAQGDVPAGSSPEAVLMVENGLNGRALHITALASSPQSAIVVDNTGTGAAMSARTSAQSGEAGVKVFNSAPGMAFFASSQANAMNEAAMVIFNRGGGRALYVEKLPATAPEPDTAQAPSISPEQSGATGGDSFAAANTGVGGHTIPSRCGQWGFSKQYWGVYGTSDEGIGVYGTTTSPGVGHAGWFEGQVVVSGDFTVMNGTKQFRIDHPLDPVHKTLTHACVESDQMMNIYRGNAVLDERGEAFVSLPDWFESLNGDFSYQLTPIGAAAPNLYVAREISGNSFGIAGGRPGLKVSWTITGVRRDRYALEHPLDVEAAKPISPSKEGAEQ